jgi:Flp pilus assembly protein CpaB
MSERLPDPVRRLLRAAAWHRRLFAAAFAAIAVVSGLSVFAPGPPPTVAVVAAAHDLAAGITLEPGDLQRVGLAPDAVPAGALRASGTVVGRMLAGPVRRGEAITDVRLVGPALLGTIDAGLVAVPVRIADAGAVRLVRPGDVVDVLAASTRLAGTPSATTVAAGARVLAVPQPDDSGLGDGALIVLAASPETAALLARAAVTARLSVTIRP